MCDSKHKRNQLSTDLYVCVCLGVSFGYLAHFRAKWVELRRYIWWQQSELVTSQPGDDSVPPAAPHKLLHLFIRRLTDLSHGRLHAPPLCPSGRCPAGSLASDWLERAGGGASSP